MAWPIVSDGKGGLGDVAEAPVEAANQEYAKTSPGTSGFLSAFDRSENPVGSTLLPRAEQAQYREHDWFRDYIAGNAAAYGSPITSDDMYVRSPTITAADANKRFPNPDPNGKPLFSEAMPEKLAETIAKQKGQQYQAETDMARFAQNNSFPVRFGASVVASLLDPINLATAFVPGLGEEAIAARGLGIAGRTAFRSAEFGGLSALQEAPIAGLKLAFADDLHTDYSIRNALSDMLMAAGTGVAMGGLFGAASEGLRALRGRDALTQAIPVATANAETNHAAGSTAVSQLVTGKPVDVADFFPRPHTDTAVGQFIDHPFLQKVEPVDLGLDRREVARTIDPKIMREFEAAEQQKAAAAAQVQELNKAAQPVASVTGDLVQDQIERLESQLAGKLSKAKRAAAESKLADLRDQFEAQGVPTKDDLRAAQQALQDADNHLRDMVATIAPVMQRADETMARATAAETGNRLDDLLARQRQFMRPDYQGILEREKAWRDSGVAPGISHSDLVAAQGEVREGAKNAQPAPTPKNMPEGWAAPQKPEERASEQYDRAAEIAKTEGKIGTSRIQREFGIGYVEAGRVRDQLIKDGVIDEAGKRPVEGATGAKAESGATSGAKPEQAAQRAPQRFEDVYPEYSDKGLSPDERAQLMDAHRDVEKATLREAAYQEAAKCLKGG